MMSDLFGIKSHFAPSALGLILNSGVLGRMAQALTFRAFGAHDSAMQLSFNEAD
jgi:hypothetical protein